MNKQNTKKLTLEDFINKKISKDNKINKTKEIYVESMDGYLTAKMLSEDKILELLDLSTDDGPFSDQVELNKQLVYHTIPYLQSTELHTALDITDPLDIVSAIFSIGEITALSNELLTFLDIDGTVDKIKN